VGGDLEARVGPRRARGRAAGVDREHEHLVAEPVGDLGDQLGPVDRGGVDRDLVGAGPQQPVDVLDAAHPAADGERDEDLLGRARHDLHRRRAALVEAEMSRKVSSSAPSASYVRASSTGSPASRRSVKLTPLTTRPASTSRHGITRTARRHGVAPG
jgi:hypothetical protein